MHKISFHSQGFTLIELSIVLVIIGLIIGGVLVGQDLIRTAEVRAQLSQIEKYNSAVNTFRSKFNAIPGDMRPEVASQFGFTVGAGCTGVGLGYRDGNGLIDYMTPGYPLGEGGGETGLFWQDLSSPSAGGLIDGTFPSGGTAIACNAYIYAAGTGLNQYFPTARIGYANYMYVYDWSGANWFSISGLTSISNAHMYGNTNIPVIEAYRMDTKVDDGNPLTGNVQAMYVGAAGATQVTLAPYTTTSGGNSTSCYDTTTSTYSITQSNGNTGNCAISFKFQ